MLVRWLGAYGASASLADSLAWEITQRERQVVAERVQRGHYWRMVTLTGGRVREVGEAWGQGFIFHARVGLWIDGAAVIRAFPRDVWSRVDENGRLYATRSGSPSHSEVFCHPGHVKAIIVKDHPSTMKPDTLRAIRDVAIVRHGLPVFYLSKRGKRTLVTELVARYRG